MRILITGSNGLLGQKLVTLLIAQSGHEVVATSRGPNRLPSDEGYQYHTLDITDPQAVARVLDDIRPEAIINTAAMTNVDQCEDEKEDCIKLNVDAVSSLIDGAQRYGSFLLQLSTDFIFDGESGPYDEEAIPNPISFYGESKLKAEKLVSQCSNWAIARTILVYGVTHKMSRSNLVLWVKRCLENQEPIQVVNDQWRSPTLAEDLAAGCGLIVDRQAQGIFNISGKDLLTPYQMAIRTADFFGLDPSFITESDWTQFTQPAKRPPKTGLVITKAQDKLNYQPKSFEEGLQIVAEQIKAES